MLLKVLAIACLCSIVARAVEDVCTPGSSMLQVRVDVAKTVENQVSKSGGACLSCESIAAAEHEVSSGEVSRDTKTDVAFLLDSSNIISGVAYQWEKNFVKGVAGKLRLRLSEADTQVGVISYSDSSTISIKLKEHRDEFSLMPFFEAVDRIQRSGWDSHMNRALRQAQREFFSPANGGRQAFRKTIILLKGEASEFKTKRHEGWEEPANIAKELRDAGVSIIAVGMGKASESELLGISGSKQDTFMASFRDLSTEAFIDKVTHAAFGSSV